jgi:ribokinase
VLGPHEVVVVGSANVDVRLQVEDLPRGGETVLALGRDVGAGGKGVNQAVAAARSGARTAFIGAFGDDAAAATLGRALGGAGVDTALVRTSTGPSGTAYVVVERSGENLIVVDPGANASLVDLTQDERAVIGAAAVVLCQLEVPLATVAAAAAAAGGIVVLNAAPAADLPAGLLDDVDVLVVNEHEACAVAGGAASALDALDDLLARVRAVVITRGAAGMVLAQRDGRRAEVPAIPARAVVDTTGAGDTFCGALAAALAHGADLEPAARRAAAAGSLSVERFGAGESAPTADEVTARLAAVERDER